MSYERQNFADGQTLTADMLNHIEDGLMVASNKGTILSSYPDPSLIWEIGAINLDTGANTTASNCIRTTAQVFAPKGTKIGLIDPAIHFYNAALYDKDGAFLKAISPSWITADTIIEEDCYIRFCMRHSDNRTIDATITNHNGGITGLGNNMRVLKPTYNQDIADSRWNGKNIIVYGDSISDEDKFGIKKYCTFIANWLNCRVKNTAIGGAGWKNWAYNATDSLIEQSQIDYGSDYDLVIIFCGTNDYGNNGGIAKDEFTSAVDTVLDRLKNKYPFAKFLVATSLRRGDNDITVKNSKGMTLNDYCEIQRDACKKRGIALLDLYYMGNFFVENATFAQKYTYKGDKCHPSEEWHEKVLAFQFLNAIRGL